VVTFKDLFSSAAASYARFRPAYPAPLFAWLGENLERRRLAVDVGTGSGQVAVALASHFDAVLAVDPSEAQLANAVAHPRVEYRRAAAEATEAATASADLLVAGQAFHWFRQEPFFAEVRRVVRPGGLFAVWCYALARISPEVDAVVGELYQDYLGPYWQPERGLVESHYREVIFPASFLELPAPPFEMQQLWRLEHLVGYLGTWSPLESYQRAKGVNPLEAILPQLTRAWGPAATEREVRWPVGLRAFRL
jgi:SAM-dependent methyltransferase